jgi:hypothetical protein
VKQLDREFEDWPPEVIQAIKAPTLVVIGDSDIVRPEHAVELFRMLGGGVSGDVAGLPPSQLAILPGTTHITLVERADWLLSMITAFLDAPCRRPSQLPTAKAAPRGYPACGPEGTPAQPLRYDDTRDCRDNRLVDSL